MSKTSVLVCQIEAIAAWATGEGDLDCADLFIIATALERAQEKVRAAKARRHKTQLSRLMSNLDRRAPA